MCHLYRSGHRQVLLAPRGRVLAVGCPVLSRAQEDAMANLGTDDPVIARFRAALDSAFGERIERVVLYGSRARGDARPDSDYDVAVFLRDMDDRWPEMKRLADISTEILIDTDEFVHAMPFRAGAWNERTPLMREIRIEGIDL
jgi:predicted nucleotidyltransferase